MDYIHIPELAPTKEILDAYKKNGGNWDVYEDKFLELMEQREIEKTVSNEIINQGCLLCSEDKPQYCHRRLVVDYLKSKWDEELNVIHLF